MKGTIYYFAYVMSLAGHLNKICQSDPEEIVGVKIMETICKNTSMLEPPQEDTTGNVLNLCHSDCLTQKKNWTRQRKILN